MTNINFRFRKGAGSNLDIIFGTVTLKPTLAHSRGTSMVLPAPSTWDIINGEVLATNVQPTPEPVDGVLEWGYEVTVKDRHGKSYSFLVGVPDSTTDVEFVSLPRYFETKPPLFGQGPKGDAGEAATISVGTVTSGTTAKVTNSGTSSDAKLDFVLPKGDKGDKGDGVPEGGTEGQTIQKTLAGTVWADINKALVGLGNVDNTSDASKPVSALQLQAIEDSKTLPVRSKRIDDPASSYPKGTTVTAVSGIEGWPKTDTVSEFSIAATHIPKGYDVALQYLSPYNNSAAGTSLDNPNLLYRVGSSAGRWSEFKKLAVDSGDLVREGQEGVVYASTYGAEGAIVGDGVNNDYWTIQRAINAGREVILEGGKTYRIAGTLSMPANGRNSVCIRATGSDPAILKLGADGQSYPAIKFEQNTISATTKLTKSISHGTYGWPVESTAGIEPGMLCEVKSSALWYFDPRDTARKSELHKVRKVEGNTVYFEDVSNDGYTIPTETVTLTFYKAIKVHLENLKIQGTLPSVAEESKAVIGLEISHADSPKLIDVDVEDCARTGIRAFVCYRPQILGGQTTRANNFYNGYGVSIDGCAHAFVWNRFSYECRRHTDVTGQQIVSRMSTIQSCTAVGGGKNSRGNNYGWNPDGSIGDDQFGFGTHGPADQTRYIDNTTMQVSKPYMLRGRDEMIVNLRHVGRTYGGVIACSSGTNLVVQGGWAVGGYWGYKDASTYNSAQPSSAWMRPDYFLRIYPGYQMNPPTGTARGRLIIQGVTAEVRNRAIWFADNTLPLGRFELSGRWAFSNPVGSDDVALMFLPGTEPPTGKSNWFIGPNSMKLDTGTGNILTNFGFSLSGANVLNYTTA